MFNSVVYSQSRLNVVLVQGKNPTWEITRTITNKTDTLVYFYMSYQNQKYQYVTDIGSVLLTRKSELAAFMEMLWVIAEMEPGISYSDKVGNVKISRFSSSNNVCITNKDGKYTYLNKKQIHRMVGELENYIELFKD